MNAQRPLFFALAACLAMAGCGEASKPAPPASSSSMAAGPVASTSATPPRAASASPVASPPTSPAPFASSPEPELAEWGKAREIKVAGSGKNACETKLVREWIRVMCVNRSAELGKPVKIDVTSGRSATDHSKGENLKAVNDITTLVAPIAPGANLAATFQWEHASHVFTASWPAGSPESSRTMAFDNADEAPAESAAAPVSGSAATASAAPAPSAEPALDDVAGLGDPPTDDEWKKAPEVRFAGSSAAGCETKVLRDWFRARCADTAKPVDAITPLRGFHRTQTRVEVAGGVATLVTPYVEDTETWARFAFHDGVKTLVLRWKKGPRPDSAGSFETGK